MSLGAVMAMLGSFVDTAKVIERECRWYCWECGRRVKGTKRKPGRRCRKCGSKMQTGRPGWVNKFYGGRDPNRKGAP